MGVLSALRDGALEVVKRWIPLLPGNPELGLPPLEVEVRYTELDELAEVNQKFPNYRLDHQQRSNRQSAFGKKVVCGFRELIEEKTEVDGDTVVKKVERDGISKNNLRRLLPRLVKDKKAMRSLPDVVTLDESDIAAACGKMDPIHFNTIENGAISMEEFAIEQIEREKKDSERSSLSSQPDSPQAPAQE